MRKGDFYPGRFFNNDHNCVIKCVRQDECSLCLRCLDNHMQGKKNTTIPVCNVNNMIFNNDQPHAMFINELSANKFQFQFQLDH
jgi:hypothetical protein